MALRYLDHVNLRTTNVATMTQFYCAVLGLRSGARPPFEFGGAWLYCGERAVVHLVEVNAPPDPSSALRLEHFAFAADDFDSLIRSLTESGIEYRISQLTGSETRQVNLRDPDGNRVHIDFPDHLAK